MEGGETSSGGLAVAVSGMSAYDVAVANGFVGTEAASLASLKIERGSRGEQGEPGETEASAYELWLAEGNTGEKTDSSVSSS